MAAWDAEGLLDGLIHHADHGSNYMSMVAPTGSSNLARRPRPEPPATGFDNALAEAVNNLYETEPIRQKGPWRAVEQVEPATLEWVWWWNSQRLHGQIGMRTPIEIEDAYYADLESVLPVTA